MSTGGDQLEPDRLETADFPIVRRGFDPDLVRTQLVIVADEIRRLRRLVADLESSIADLEVQAPADLEARKITEAIGEEAVRVLDAARQAAAERDSRAEDEAAAIVAAAKSGADAIISDAERDRDRLLGEAERAAAEIVETGRAQGRDMVAEAQAVRERMLQDLAHKRQTHRAEVEQLRAGRDRLLESLVDAQNTLADSTADLLNAVPEAQAAAERAGLRVTGEPELTVEQLEAEIVTARLVDHPLVDGVADPGPVGDENDAPSVTDNGTAAVYDVETEPEPVGSGEPDGPAETAEPVGSGEPDGPAETAEPVGSAETHGLAETAGPADPPTDSSADPAAAALQTVDAAWAEDAEASEVDDLFARLRSSRKAAVDAAASVLADAVEPVESGDRAEQSDSGESGDRAEPSGSGEPVDRAEPSDSGELGDRAEQSDSGEPEESVDPDGTARETALDELSRALKRLVVDEQGELLDGIRRDGPDAIRVVLEGREAAYVGAVSEPLRVLVEAVAGPELVIGTDEAESSVRSLLVEPVRSRLFEALEDTDDPDELSTTVRAVYRECRSRRVGEAASAAVASAFEVAVGARPAR